MGERFHGNIVQVQNGVPALFLTVDSRTSELTEFFDLPHIPINSFDANKPIEYYFEQADYSQFNKNYKAKRKIFLDFLKKNNLVEQKCAFKIFESNKNNKNAGE